MKIFDLHTDTATKAFERGVELFDRELAVNTDELSCFETAVINYAIWFSDVGTDNIERYKTILTDIKQKLQRQNIPVLTDASGLCTSSAMLSVEGGILGDDVSFVDMLYTDGIKTLSLTWNYSNKAAGGALDVGGLTKFGGSIIDRLNQHSMALDLSHLNEESFFGALDLARFPLATHSGVYAQIPNKRNLSDTQLKALSRKNGIVGLPLYPEFIGKNVFEGFYKAVTHCISLGLENNIALGSDFDGAEMSESLSSISKLQELYAYLHKKGLSEEILDKIFFQNALLFYNRVLTNQ